MVKHQFFRGDIPNRSDKNPYESGPYTHDMAAMTWDRPIP